MNKGLVSAIAGASMACAAACAVAAVACSLQTIFPGGVNPPPGTASQQVGAAGGTVTTNDGTSVYIPPNALQSEVTITIGLATDAGAPQGATPVGVPHVFGPPGLVFYGPVCVTMGFEPPILPQGTTEANVLLYEDVPPLVDDAGATGEAGGDEGGAAEGGAGDAGEAGVGFNPCIQPCPPSGDGGDAGDAADAADGGLPAGAEAGDAGDAAADAAVSPDGAPLPTGYPVGAYFPLPSFPADPAHVTGLTRQLGTISLAYASTDQELETGCSGGGGAGDGGSE